MKRLARHLFARGLRLVHLALLLSLVLNPLAHALVLPLASPPVDVDGGPAVAMACHHADASPRTEDASPAAGYGDCCCKQGSACHCAAAVALPSMAVALAMAPPHDYSPRYTAFLLGNPPAPEPPPPRR